MRIEGRIVDLFSREIVEGSVEINGGVITKIHRHPVTTTHYILPGFIDSHIHMESSMLTPGNFSNAVVAHGTVAVVSDPHEIANVCGIEGINAMLRMADDSEVKIFYTFPSCVPSTPFDTAGATIDSDETIEMLSTNRFVALSEVMDYPGVISREEEVMRKIEAAIQMGLPVDGHAPLLKGEMLQAYVAAGISTDHETRMYDEGAEKIALGMKILVREGSSAKSFDELIPLLSKRPDLIMFCSDDRKPKDLVEGHINKMAARAVALGYDLFDVLRAASVNPVEHYKLPIGLLREGDSADFVVTDSLTEFNILDTWINGKRCIGTPHPSIERINQFVASPITPELLRHDIRVGSLVRVIGVEEGAIITAHEQFKYDPELFSDQQISKIACLNRYHRNASPAIGFVRGFGLREGAIASSIAHDSHNVVAVGSDDILLAEVINTVVANNGGIAVSNGSKIYSISLPIGGLMSERSAEELIASFEKLDQLLEEMQISLTSPLMTLSFLCLPVIPWLKITDRGLFDVSSFTHISLQVRDK